MCFWKKCKGRIFVNAASLRDHLLAKHDGNNGPQPQMPAPPQGNNMGGMPMAPQQNAGGMQNSMKMRYEN